MSLQITISKTVDIGDGWMSKEDFDEHYKDDKQKLIDLFEEDPYELLEQAGGLNSLIVSYGWVDD